MHCRASRSSSSIRSASRRTALSSCKSALAAASNSRERNQRELQGIAGGCEECREAIDALPGSSLRRRTRRTATCSSRARRLLGRIDKEDERYQELVEREKRLEAQEESSQRSCSFSKGSMRRLKGTRAASRRCSTANRPGFCGSVADLIRVTDEGCVGLVEKMLGPAVQTAVFDTEENLRSAVRYLHEEKVGFGAHGRARPDRPAGLPRLFVRRQGRPCARSLRTAAGCEALPALSAVRGHHHRQRRAGAGAFAGRTDAPYTFVGRDGVICKGRRHRHRRRSEKGAAPGILWRGRLRSEKLAANHRTVRKRVCRDDAGEGDLHHQPRRGEESAGRGGREAQQRAASSRRSSRPQSGISKASSKRSAKKSTGAAAEARRTRCERSAALEADIAAKRGRIAAQQGRYEELEAQVDETGRASGQWKTNAGRWSTGRRTIELEVQGLRNRLQQDRQDVERLTKENAQGLRPEAAEARREAEGRGRNRRARRYGWSSTGASRPRLSNSGRASKPCATASARSITASLVGDR